MLNPNRSSGASTSYMPAHVIEQILEEELREDATTAELQQALSAALLLLPYPRATWPMPTTRWEQLVYSMGVATLRAWGNAHLGWQSAARSVRAALNRRPRSN